MAEASDPDLFDAATPTSTEDANPGQACHPRYAIYPECPLCGAALHPEHAHFKCRTCGWRDSCCD